MNDKVGNVYEFGRFSLDLSEQRLLRDHELVPLPPKVLDTLKTLVTHSGHILGKDELMTAIWGDTFVEESCLSRNISLLRKALQEEGDEKYIETIPKRGYRFVAPVRTIEGSAASTQPITTLQNGRDDKHIELNPASLKGLELPAVLTPVSTRPRRRQWLLILLLVVGLVILAGSYVWKAKDQRTTSAVVASNQPIKSMAVLPFKVISSDQGSEALGLGMADAIILRLSSSQDCRVRPTGAIAKYAALETDTFRAGKELGVDAVLAGTVQQVGDHVRVTVMLWGLKDGNSIWSAKFDEPFSDIFTLQDSISAQVADRLKLQLESESLARTRQFTANVQAYRNYTMGYFFWCKRSKPNLAKAIQYFSRAIEEDPNYALAYSRLADTYLLDAYYGFENLSLQDAYDKAKWAATRAQQLDTTLPEANIAVGMVMEFEGDLKGAESSFRKAIEINPDCTIARLRYGHLLASTSRLDQAVSQLRVAVDSDPASPTISQALGAYLLHTGQYDESLKYSKLALELDSQTYRARENIAWAYAEMDRYDEANAEFTALAQIPGSCQYGQIGIAYLSARKGLRNEARQLLARAIKKFENGSGFPSSSLEIAKVFCLLGEKEEAFVWIQRAIYEGRLRPYQLEYSPELDPLKTDSRFGEMVARVRNVRPPVKGIGQRT